MMSLWNYIHIHPTHQSTNLCFDCSDERAKDLYTRLVEAEGKFLADKQDTEEGFIEINSLDFLRVLIDTADEWEPRHEGERLFAMTVVGWRFGDWKLKMDHIRQVLDKVETILQETDFPEEPEQIREWLKGRMKNTVDRNSN